MQVSVFNKFGKFVAIISWNIFSTLFPLPSPSGNPNYACISSPDGVLYFSESLVIFLHFFFSVL